MFKQLYGKFIPFFSLSGLRVAIWKRDKIRILLSFFLNLTYLSVTHPWSCTENYSCFHKLL